VRADQQQEDLDEQEEEMDADQQDLVDEYQ
jgi:hypothetical protein